MPVGIWVTSPYGLSEASVPPVNTTPVPPRSTRRACATVSRPPACSVAITPQGPRMPCRIEIWPVEAA